MPPLSPVPGWISGDVCSERTARARTTGETLPSGWRFPPVHIGGGERRLGGRGGGLRDEDPGLLVLVEERLVDAQQRLLLLLGDRAIAQDGTHEVIVALALLEDAGAHVERLGGNAERLGDLLEDLGRRLPQHQLDQAQLRAVAHGHVRTRDALTQST